jgi:hypothetical protein
VIQRERLVVVFQERLRSVRVARAEIAVPGRAHSLGRTSEPGARVFTGRDAKRTHASGLARVLVHPGVHARVRGVALALARLLLRVARGALVRARAQLRVEGVRRQTRVVESNAPPRRGPLPAEVRQQAPHEQPHVVMIPDGAPAEVDQQRHATHAPPPGRRGRSRRHRLMAGNVFSKPVCVRHKTRSSAHPMAPRSFSQQRGVPKPDSSVPVAPRACCSWMAWR